jgi:hypothetical protein
MKDKMCKFLVVGFSLMIFSIPGYSRDKASYLCIDHNCTDLSKIPAQWIDSVQANLKLHYAHTSHGGQLTSGITRIEASNDTYNVAIGSSVLPTTAGAFCIFDGQEGETYITPDKYWEAASGMNETRAVFNHNSTINLSMWSWCTQTEYYSETQVQAYLDSMNKLETQYPNVTFIYMTGNAQATGSGGYNRHMRNQQIRQYCKTNDKVLFDFADLDAWWYNTGTLAWEFNSYTYSDSTIPVEHTHFNGNEDAHTTYESCEQKGKALWWMMARFAGWNDVAVTENKLITLPVSIQSYPNPFNHSTSIKYTLNKNSNIEIKIYNIVGQPVKTLVSGAQETGTHTVIWDGKDNSGKKTDNGIYFCQIKTPAQTLYRKIVIRN